MKRTALQKGSLVIHIIRIYAEPCNVTNTLGAKLITAKKAYTGRERLIRSHSSERFCFELSGNSN